MALNFFDPEKDTHESFVAKYNAGALILRVDTNAAGYAYLSIGLCDTCAKANTPLGSSCDCFSLR